MLRAFLVPVVAAAVALAAQPPADPPYYVKKSTWHATMLASREALAKWRASERSGFRPFVTPVARGGRPARRVSVDVSTLDELWLVADVGGDDYKWDQAIWAEPLLTTRDGKQVRLTTLKPFSVRWAGAA